ncbi:MAG: sodium-translocating pyrophosphatase [Pseudomonadales bacterium]|jgi:K(+)-stimulated pyrophosphate-energized sodium pump
MRPENLLEFLVGACALAGLMYAVVQTVLVVRADAGNDQMRSIASAIREGSVAFLRREYTVVFAAAVVLAAAILIAFGVQGGGVRLAAGFLLGVCGSAAAGALGVWVSVRANVRVAAHAHGGDLPGTMRFAFNAGSITGLCVAGLALLELVVLYAIFAGDVRSMAGLLVGASLMSLFARVGGGIYTKGADVGADLAGKVESRIPEDDPRNAGVIADNVGDNVGDCAGMAADLFETFVVTCVGAMLLGYLVPDIRASLPNAVVYPLALSGAGILATLIGTTFVRMSRRGTIMGALYRGLTATIAVGLAAFYGLDLWLMDGALGPFLATAVGLIVVAVLVVVTNHYTSSRSRAVAGIVDSADAGAGPVVITGLSIGLASVWMPGVIIAAGILVSFFATAWTPGGPVDPATGLYGIGLAATSMLAVMAMIVSIDALGPIVDNAGGIAEMAHLPAEAREVTDALDAVGNTTKAVTKGYAIGSAALAALALFSAYTLAAAEDLGIGWIDFTRQLTIGSPLVMVGLLLGALLPFFFTSFLMSAVSAAAQAVVFEVRRQFEEIPGLLEGTSRPEYGRCVDLVTITALRRLAVPGTIAVAAPLTVGFLLGPVALAGLLLGVILSGLPLALLMTTSGAAWDNAKKRIERGQAAERHPGAKAAAVVGDTVGDATKDTAGPAINPLIKVVNTVAILFVGLVVAHSLIGG